MADIVEADRETFYERIEEADTPVVVEFRADWCDVCKELDPVVEEIADEYEGTLEFLTVDIDESGRLANELHVPDVPTFIAYFRGNSLKRISGDVASDDIEAIVDFLTDLPRVAA